jgi:DNA-binding response OmpR family regulator
MVPRILVVEDERAIRLVIMRVLEAEHYDVLSCDTGERARVALDSLLFDLVILDVNLPDSTGWDVVRHIRATRGASLPIVVISAVTPRTARLHEYGIAGVLQKPFPMESLMRLTARLVGRVPKPIGEATTQAVTAALSAQSEVKEDEP